jgi:V/A-type H+-transporting ATPase subunit F
VKYFIIGDEDALIGFGLVGVEGRIASNPDEAAAAFEAALADTGVGVILINESVADMIRPVVDKYLFTRSFPLILEVPGREGRKPDRPRLRDLVNEAIGIKL